MILHLNAFDIVLALLLLASMIVAGILAGRKSTEEDYLVGGRAVPAGKLSATISAGVIGGGVLLVYSAYTFKYGLSAFFIIAGIVLGTLLTIPVALKFKPIADRQGFYSLSDFYEYEWGRRVALPSTFIILVWTIGFIIMQLISAGEILETMTNWPYWRGVVIAAATVASYLVISGFKAVVITDVMQYIALLVLLLIVQPAAINQVKWAGLLTAIKGSPHMAWGEAAGFFILGLLNMIVSADMWQRFYAAKSNRDAKRGLVYSAVLILVAGCFLIVPSLFARVIMPGMNENRALVASLNLLLPRWLLGFSLVAILSTIVATLDTMVFIFGISVGHDMTVQQLDKTIANRIRTTQIVIVVVLVLGSVVSILFRNLLTIGLALSTLGLVLAPSLLLRLKDSWKPTPFAVEVGMWCGLATAAVLLIGNIFVKDLLTPQNSVLALVIAILGTIGGGAWSRLSSRKARV